MDFTLGVFEIEFEEFKPDNRVNTTLAKQLALYVVLYSPLQMVTDLPENYAGNPAFQIILDVPVDWERTLGLNGSIGEFVTIARQRRGGDDWYLGALTNDQARTFEVPLNFLQPGVTYLAESYGDSTDSHWESNPKAVQISRYLVNRDTVLKLRLAAGGGQAIRMVPATTQDREDFKLHERVK